MLCWGEAPPQQEYVLNSLRSARMTMDCLLALLYNVKLDIRKDEQSILETSTSHTLSRRNKKKKGFGFMYAYVPRACLMPTEAKREQQIS